MNIAPGFLYLFLYIGVIYAAGFNVMLLAFNRILKKTNLFIVLGLSWLLGNTLFSVLFHFLAFNNKLALVNRQNFTFLSYVIGLLLVTSLFIFRKSLPKPTLANLLILLIVSGFFYPLMKASMFSPLIAWDANGIWILKAKVFFFSPGVWNNSFFQNGLFDYANKAYPIGLPLLVSGYFRLVNFANDQLVQLYLLFYYLNIVFIFAGMLRKILKQFSALTVVLITLGLFTLPDFILYSSNGYADIPLSFAFTVSSALLILMIGEENITDRLAFLMMVIVAASFGTTIKIEGYVFAGLASFIGIITFILIPGVFSRKNKSRKSKQNIFPKMLTMALIVVSLAVIFYPTVAWQYFKTKNHLGLYLDDSRLYTNMISRGKTIFTYYLNELINITRYSLVLIPSLLFFIAEASILAVNKKFRELLPSWVILLQLAAYTAIYFITPMNINLQIKSSIDRLLIHILPSFFIIMMFLLSIIFKLFENPDK